MVKLKYTEYYNNFDFITIPLNGKKPYLKKWQLSQQSKEIKNENENIGALTGKKSNLTVIDIDKKDNGMKIWRDLINIYGDIDTVKVKTPSGALHYYFQYDKDLGSFTKIKINNKKYGIDVLNDGRQVVLPPSYSKEYNKKYKYINHIEKYKINQIPSWLKDLILKNN
jgi:hypothetical protein